MNKIKFILFSTITSILLSCQTNEEKQAINTILDFYGGKIETKKGAGAKNLSGGTHFEIILKGSPLVKNYPKDENMYAGDIAFKFWSNIQKEKPTYDVVRTTLELSNGSLLKREDSKDDLNEMLKFYPKIESFNKSFLLKEEKSIKDNFDTKYLPKETDLKTLFNKLESGYGKFKQIQFQGFEFVNDSTFGRLIVVKEVLQLEKTNANLYIVFDRTTHKISRIEFP